jgi:hypothetical protein
VRERAIIGIRVLGAAVVVLLLVPAAWHVRTFVSVLSERFAYPYDIEWMESGHLYQAWRIANDLPLYTDPASGFAPFPYPPLFWMSIAGLAKLTGGTIDYTTGRAVSIASIAGSAIILALAIARRAPARWVGVAFGFVAIASIGAAYPIGDGSFDLARSDALATFLPIAAAALAGGGRGLTLARCICISLLLVASGFTKQTDVFFVAWVLVFVLARDLRAGVRIAAMTIVLSAAIFAFAVATTHGFFFTWMFDMSQHEIQADRWADPIAAFVRHNPFLLFLPLLVGWLRWKRRLGGAAAKWTGMFVAALLGALLAHMKKGGYVNVYTPVLVLSWPVVLYVACDALRAIWPNRPRALVATYATLGLASLFLQLLEYHTHPFLPVQRQRDEAARILSFVRDLDGEVVVTTNAFLAIRAGKRCTQPMLQAYFDAGLAGMPVDFADALDKSGAVYVITTGTDFEGDLAKKLEPKFERVSAMEIHWGTLPAWDHGNPKTLWRRRR